MSGNGKALKTKVLSAQAHAGIHAAGEHADVVACCPQFGLQPVETHHHHPPHFCGWQVKLLKAG